MSRPLTAIGASLATALQAGVPLIALVTHEEERTLRALIGPLAERETRGRCFVWSITDGCLPLAAAIGEVAPDLAEEETLTAPDPASALEAVHYYPEPALFVLKDFHSYLESAPLLRRLRDLAARLPGTGKHVLFLSPRFTLPEELEKAVELVDIPLPDMAEIDALLEEALAAARDLPPRPPSPRGKGEKDALSCLAPPSPVGRGAGGVGDLMPRPMNCLVTPEERERLVQAALGLTATEARQSFARALARGGDLAEGALGTILAEKKQAVRRSGILEFYEAGEGMAAVGGLELLKLWLAKRYLAFSADARRYGLSEPRGVLLLGVQGCGKSLVAKAVSHAWQMPLLRLDLGRVFGRYLGESEAGIRTAIRTAEAVAPAILWLDELEKGFAGATTAAHDTGVSARVLGTFLTWMQEREKPVFVVATANSVRHLPPELLRRGRFDEIFFIELPTASERRAILAVHLQKRGRDPVRFDLDRLTAASDGYTGAEIEGAINDALFDAYADNRREVTSDDLLAALAATTPIAVTMREPISAMRQWAATRARPASAGEGGVRA